jgi:hypothetical protein
MIERWRVILAGAAILIVVTTGWYALAPKSVEPVSA